MIRGRAQLDVSPQQVLPLMPGPPPTPLTGIDTWGIIIQNCPACHARNSRQPRNLQPFMWGRHRHGETRSRRLARKSPYSRITAHLLPTVYYNTGAGAWLANTRRPIPNTNDCLNRPRNHHPPAGILVNGYGSASPHGRAIGDSPADGRHLPTWARRSESCTLSPLQEMRQTGQPPSAEPTRH